MAETEKFVFMCGAAAQSEHSSSRKEPARMSGKAQFGVSKGGCCCCCAFWKSNGKRQNKHLIDLFGSVSASGAEIWKYLTWLFMATSNWGSGRCVSGSHSWMSTDQTARSFMQLHVNHFIIQFWFWLVRDNKAKTLSNIEVTKSFSLNHSTSGHWVLKGSTTSL